MRATSNRKLAEALGVSEAAVRKALAAGRISREADGSFDIAEVKRQWAGNTDAAQQRPTAKSGPILRPVPAAALASVRETLRDQGEEPAPGSPSFLQARTANEVLKAQERRPRLQRLKGELIDRAPATAQVFTLARPKSFFTLEKGNYWSNNYMNSASLASLGLICCAGNRPGQVISRGGGHRRGGMGADLNQPRNLDKEHLVDMVKAPVDESAFKHSFLAISLDSRSLVRLPAGASPHLLLQQM